MEQKTFTIVWDPQNGIAMTDAKIDAWVEKVVRAANVGIAEEVHVGQELLVNALRVKIREGAFSEFQMQIRRADGRGHSYINQEGKYEDFFDVFKIGNREDCILDEILSALI